VLDQYSLKSAAKWVLPTAVYRPVLAWWRRPRPKSVRWGGLRRLSPVSREFGLDRGQPIDRYYIENFLQTFSTDIRGRVLEIGDSTYTRKFGGGRVASSDVLHAASGNRAATLVGNLETGEGIPRDQFDCIILTQVFPFIFDVKAAVRNSHSMIKPGGVLLATLSGISQISRYDMDHWGDYWRFTSLSARRLFEEVFPPENVIVETHGNVLAAVALLHGLAADELKREELDCHDPDYEVSIVVRAVKPLEGD